jgi:putative tryptophan/tyrosine transport system permease protein
MQFLAIVSNSLEEASLYAYLALGVLITFRFFRFPDLTAEGSYPLGGSVAATLMVNGVNPFAATFAAILAGALAGGVTALVHTRLRINNIVSGIIVMTALYSVNLNVMGRPNVSLLATRSVFDDFAAGLAALGMRWGDGIGITILLACLLVAAGAAALIWFMRTELGLAVRATGENEAMIQALGVDTAWTKLVGLAISNGAIALSGALVAQNNGFADIGMGIGILVTGAAAVMIGESLFGDGSILRWIVAVLTGVAIYELLVVVALRVGLDPIDLKLVTAVLLLASLSLPRFRARLLGRR